MNPLVSVIIPVYNTAQYLDNCIQSVCDQTLSDWEIILVDDGATDDSPQMCDVWVSKDDRIHVIHKKNEGLGLTRNAGLTLAQGEFVCFLDSDDTIDADTLKSCVDTLKREKADACFYGRKTQGKDGNFTVNKKIPEKLVFVGDEVKKEYAQIYM
ncbi:MAG: glycosyltransferase family 2 protein, partial [Eubacterium sp.]|nr:glycosyltransferase family 2 protein [Eubacterium sp.]